MKQYLQITILVLLIGPFYAKAQKTDTLFHINGNILLGEIKKLDYGQFTFKMTGMGTILVDIDKVATVKSNKFFEFTTRRGRSIFGSIDSTSIIGMIQINSGYDSSYFHLSEIIEIFPIQSTLFLRTSGKISMGFNYTKASNIGRYNIDWNIVYRNKKTRVSLTSSSVETFSPNDTLGSSSKYDFSINLEKRVVGIWSWTASFGGNHNSELGLNLRLNGGLGMVADVVHTNNQRVFMLIGLAPNLEFAQDGSKNTTNMEGQLALSYQVYKYSFPEVSVNTKLNYYPSFNNLGRHRVDYNLDVNIEVFYNFYVGGKFYYNFDSKPATETAANNDFGFTTTIGYSFH